MEVGGQPVVARRNTAEVFETIEHPLDGIAIAIEHVRVILGGMLGAAPCASIFWRTALVS